MVPGFNGRSRTRCKCPPAPTTRRGSYAMAKKSTSKQAESTKKSVSDAQLEKLAAPLIKTGASATAIIKTLRQSGYSFSGKRVRAMYTGKPAPKPAIKAALTKGKAKVASAKGNSTPAAKPKTAKPKDAAKVTDAEAGLGIHS